MNRLRSLPVIPLALLAACTGVRTLSDPTVLVQTTGGSELGVSTDYGVAFLGRTAQAGNVHITAWFGDGPQTESSAIEPVGGGIFTAETEIRLPDVPMSFVEPKAGDEVLVVGRVRGETWQRTARVRSDPRVTGLLLPWMREFERSPDQVGAGVFVLEDPSSRKRGPVEFFTRDDPYKRKRLVGLVSGVLTLSDATGSKRYLAVVGPQDLWRLVAHRRETDRRRRPVDREDIR